MDINNECGTKELKIDEIKKISLSLGKITRLFISGGEPFLREDLPEICEIFFRQNKIEYIHLPTNGFATQRIYEYTNKILNNCPGVKLTLSLSLDGFEETHDKIKNKIGSFKNVIESIKLLSPLKVDFNNFVLYIITVVNKVNCHEVVELSEFIYNNLPVDGHGPSPMRGLPYESSLSCLSHQEWNELSKELLKFHYLWSKKKASNDFMARLLTNRIKYLYGIYTKVLKGDRLPFKCQAGNLISVIEPNGDVRLCELTEPIGNVKNFDYNIRKVLLSPQAKIRMRQVKKCACVHACFLTASIRRNPFALFKSCFLG